MNKCLNFEVCNGETDPQLEVCPNCTSRRIFDKKDKLTFKNDIECPICLEVKRGVTNINCEHYICIDCFKTCHWIPEEEIPPFPFDREKEEDYDENPEKYENDPAIKTWLDCSETCYREWCEKVVERQNLYLCPICRQ